jgi:5'-3' exonuclease
MFAAVFRYIEKLVNIAQPQKLLYMAIDGAVSQSPCCAALR